MELRQLSTFIQVAQLKSFSRAAESLGYSQSAVTVQIRQLEEELDTRLFDRIGKHISLTARGVQFLEHAYDVLQEVNKARLSVSDTGELHGRLHIGTIESLCFSKLPAVLHAYWQRHPKVVVHVTTGEPKFLIERMERGELDLIYILDEPRYSNNWNKLMEQKERVVFVTSASLGAELEGIPELTVEDLLTGRFISRSGTPTTAGCWTAFWPPGTGASPPSWSAATRLFSSASWRTTGASPCCPGMRWSRAWGRESSP